MLVARPSSAMGSTSSTVPPGARCSRAYRAIPTGSPMSWRQSKKQMRSYVPGYDARGRRPRTRCVPRRPPPRPALVTSRSTGRGSRTRGSWSWGTRRPSPRPRLRDRSRCRRRARRPAAAASTPSSAGIQVEVRNVRYPGRKNHSVPRNRQGWWSPQLNPPSPRNASRSFSPSVAIAMMLFIPRAMKVGADSSTSRAPTSSDIEYRSPVASYDDQAGGGLAVEPLTGEARVAARPHRPGRRRPSRRRLRQRPVVAQLVAEPDAEADHRSGHVARQLADHLLDPGLVDGHGSSSVSKPGDLPHTRRNAGEATIRRIPSSGQGEPRGPQRRPLGARSQPNSWPHGETTFRRPHRSHSVHHAKANRQCRIVMRQCEHTIAGGDQIRLPSRWSTISRGGANSRSATRRSHSTHVAALVVSAPCGRRARTRRRLRGARIEHDRVVALPGRRRFDSERVHRALQKGARPPTLRAVGQTVQREPDRSPGPQLVDHVGQLVEVLESQHRRSTGGARSVASSGSS